MVLTTMFPPKHPRRNGHNISNGNADMTTMLHPTRPVKLCRRIMLTLFESRLATPARPDNRTECNMPRNGSPLVLWTHIKLAKKLP